MISNMVTIVVAGIFHRRLKNSEPEVLLFQRALGDAGEGMYEFPGGKLEPGESESQALVRELQEEIAIKVRVKDILGSAEFQAPSGRKFNLKVFFVEGPVDQIQLLEHQHMKWVSRSTLILDEVAIGDRPLMEGCFQKLDTYYGNR